jgi:hypothetical protein
MITFNHNFLKPALHFIKSFYFLAFLHGVLITAIFFTATESTYEEQIFNIISGRIKENYAFKEDKDSFAVRATYMTNFLLTRRHQIFSKDELKGFKAEWIHPSTVDLMTARGGCGSFVNVLARIMKANDYSIRVVQMEVNGVKGGHIVMEAKSNGRWVVLDPLFNQYFVRPDGHLASAEDVSKNWPYYNTQIRKDYLPIYSYKNIRYTNWEKIPVLMPAIKKVLDLTLGKQRADQISIRPYFLRINHVIVLVLVSLYFLLLLFTLKVIYKERKKNTVAALKNKKAASIEAA